MEKKSLLFTFDYELFLGKRSGSVERCVIEPTRKLLDIFSANKITQAIFFVDTTWLCKLKGIVNSYSPARQDYDKVVKQLKEIAAKGHYIFPHLHPHWLNATYLSEINQWQLINLSLYRFHNLDKQERETVFSESVKLLKEILGQDYKPDAYRAGGWSIQPFEDFEPLFRQYSIKYDFSVLPKAKHISSGQQYDFSDIDIISPYLFSTDVTVGGKGDYVEFPISVMPVSSIKAIQDKALLKYLSWRGIRSYGDGQGVVAETKEKSENGSEMVAIELLTSVKLNAYLEFLKKSSYMQFIAHPKMLSTHNLNTFNKFLERARSRYNLETDFLKMVPPAK